MTGETARGQKTMCDKDANVAGGRGQDRIQQSTMCNSGLGNEDTDECNGSGHAVLKEAAAKSFPEESRENAVKELEASVFGHIGSHLHR